MGTFAVTRAANGWYATSPRGGVRPIKGWADIVRARADFNAIEEWTEEAKREFVSEFGPERRPDSGPSATSWSL